jgi:hypothetical protein
MSPRLRVIYLSYLIIELDDNTLPVRPIYNNKTALNKPDENHDNFRRMNLRKSQPVGSASRLSDPVSVKSILCCELVVAVASREHASCGALSSVCVQAASWFGSNERGAMSRK